MPHLRTSRGRFAFDAFGDAGPVVYLLHGLTAKRQDWGIVPQLLSAEGFQVFAFDLRGHGESERPESGFTPRDFSDDIASWAIALGHCSIHLVGHSASGRHALVHAVERPEKILSLTILDQALGPNLDRWKKYKAIYEGYPTPFSDEAALDMHLRRRFPDDTRFQYYKGLFGPLPEGRWDWNFSTRTVTETQRLGRDRSYVEWISKAKCPVIFIKGGSSRHVEPEEETLVRSLLPPERYVVIPGAGHVLWKEHEVDFVEMLAGFMRSV